MSRQLPRDGMVFPDRAEIGEDLTEAGARGLDDIHEQKTACGRDHRAPRHGVGLVERPGCPDCECPHKCRGLGGSKVRAVAAREGQGQRPDQDGP